MKLAAASVHRREGGGRREEGTDPLAAWNSAEQRRWEVTLFHVYPRYFPRKGKEQSAFVLHLSGALYTQLYIHTSIHIDLYISKSRERERERGKEEKKRQIEGESEHNVGEPHVIERGNVTL